MIPRIVINLSWSLVLNIREKFRINCHIGGSTIPVCSDGEHRSSLNFWMQWIDDIDVLLGEWNVSSSDIHWYDWEFKRLIVMLPILIIMWVNCDSFTFSYQSICWQRLRTSTWESWSWMLSLQKRSTLSWAFLPFTWCRNLIINGWTFVFCCRWHER